MTNYRKGAAIEREFAKLLESVGYRVTRSSGSHGMWDLIAVHPTHVRLIQVKAGKKPRITPADREGIEMEMVPAMCSKEIWLRKDGDKAPVVEVVR